jgi:hypothetical protein
LTNEFDNQLSFFRDYKALRALLKNCLWYYAFAKSTELKGVAQHLDPHRRAPDLEWVDLARDHSHPGPEAHRRICAGFISVFSRMNGLQQLQETALQL